MIIFTDSGAAHARMNLLTHLPHPLAIAMQKRDDSADNLAHAQVKSPVPNDKKERLAKALRENLLRRKTAARKADEAES